MTDSRRKRRASERRHDSGREASTVAPPRRERTTVHDRSQPNAASGRLLNAYLAVALVALTAVLYWPVRHYPFIGFDDPGYVTENPRVAAGLTWQGIRWSLTAGYFANWHPLTWMSHMTDVQLFGMNSGPHHVVNVVLHLANTVLLFAGLSKLTRSPGRSAVVAGLFAVHPMHVESVAWIAERKDVLSTAFWLLTTWAYVAYARHPRVSRYVLVLVLFALGLMSKPMLVTLPCALLLLDVWPLRRVVIGESGRRAWLRLVYEKIPMFALAVASSVITYLVQRKSGAVESLNLVSVPVRIANAIIAYWTYLEKLAVPHGLGLLYPYPTTIFVGSALLALAALAAITALAVRAMRTRVYLLVGWLWFLGTLVPVIGIVQVGKQTMADRYTYIPSIGLIVMVVWGIADLFNGTRLSRRVAPALAFAVVLAFAALARRQLRFWQSSVELWEHTVAVTGANYLAENNLGWELDRDHRPAEAVPHYLESIRLRPRFIAAHSNLGLALAELGRTDEAIEQFQQALQLDPKNYAIELHLGFALSRAGRLDDAAAYLSDALQLKPDYAEAHNALGLVRARKGDVAAAIGHYEDALRYLPNFPEAHSNLGAALAGQGKLDEAISHFREAVRLKPDMADAHNNLGVALSSKGLLDEAILQFTEVVRLNPNYAGAHNGLAVAFQRQGRTADAAREFRQVLRLRPGDADAIRALQALGENP